MIPQVKDFLAALSASVEEVNRQTADAAKRAANSPDAMFYGPTSLQTQMIELATELNIDGQMFKVKCIWAAAPVNETLAQTASNMRKPLYFQMEESNG